MGHSEGMIIFTQMHSSEERLEKKDIYIYIFATRGLLHPQTVLVLSDTYPWKLNAPRANNSLA